MKTLLPAALLCFLFLPVIGFGQEAATRPNPHAAVLLEMGIEPTAEAIGGYLERLHPDERQQLRIAELIAQLGAHRFAEREEATIELLKLPQLPIAELQAAGAAGDPEVRWRSKQILSDGAGKSSQVLYAALSTIALEQLSGLADPVLRAVPLCHEEYLRHAARRAIQATAEEQDAPRFEDALATDGPHVRRAAAVGLAAIYADGRSDELAGLLEASDPWVRYEAARGLGNVGDRRALAVFGELLSHEDLELRAKAAGMLRGLTAMKMVFTAYDQPAVREKQAKAWRDWIAARGAEAELHFPVGDASQVEIGRTLLALYTEHRVLEIDRDGKIIMDLKGNQGPWGAKRLENGNLLVNWFSSNVVIEYGPDNEEVWRLQTETYPWSAQRLENGNTLIAVGNKVVEFNQEGKSVWEAAGLGEYMADADRLDNGNTLIVCMSHSKPGRVVEVNVEGTVVWEVTELSTPYRAERLENGNTLITEKNGGRVLEYDPSGKKTVKTWDGLNSPDSAQRLTNGNTLIADAAGVREYSPDGDVVWEYRPGSNRIIAVRY